MVDNNGETVPLLDRHHASTSNNNETSGVRKVVFNNEKSIPSVVIKKSNSYNNTKEEKEGSFVVMKDYNDKNGLLLSNILPSSSSVLSSFPKTENEIHAINEILESEMDSLSLDERDKILFDIHGLSHDPSSDKEHPDKINKLLAEMDLALLNSNKGSKAAYEEAKLQNPSYVSNRSFRLMFLRAAEYNPKEASIGILNHFQIKKDIFGSSGEILGRDITLEDLSYDDIQCLKSGYIQISPTRDVAGRSIFFIAPRYRKYKNLDNVSKSFWYFMMSCIQNDDEIQRKGVILVIYNTMKNNNNSNNNDDDDDYDYDGSKKSPINVSENIKYQEIQFVQRIHSIRLGLPKNLRGCHFCGLDVRLRPFLIGMRLFFGKELRTRLKDHYGSYEEIIFRMQTYGINAKDHPLKNDGTFSLKWHHEWITIRQAQESQQQQAQEAAAVASEEEQARQEQQQWRKVVERDDEDDSTSTSSNSMIIKQKQGTTTSTSTAAAKINGGGGGVIVPRRFDVLFGRSKQCREHTGNLRASHLCDMYQQQYDSGSKFDKTTIAEKIVDIIIEESNGRFLKKDKLHNTGWYEVDRDTAREKISHYFRLKRATAAAKKQQQKQQQHQQQEQEQEEEALTTTMTGHHHHRHLHHEHNNHNLSTATKKSKRRV